jgi:hypothetical protein
MSTIVLFSLDKFPRLKRYRILVFLSAITSIGLLRNSVSNYKLKCIGFYTNFLRGVEID